MTKVAMICSSGGHLLQLYRLKPCLEKRPNFWVSFETEDAQSLLKGERVYWAHHPTNRNLKNFLKNLWLAAKILKQERPTHLISTGAGVSVPFIYVARLLGIKTVYVESLARVYNISLSGKLVYFVADHFLVQWESLARRLRRATFAGQVI